MNNYIPPENRITLEDIKRWVRNIKSLFDKSNYKNEAFFKTVVTVLVVFFITSGISGIYLSYKIFNFVTGNVTSLRTEVNHKVYCWRRIW